jgi:hypothetical protein
MKLAHIAICASLMLLCRGPARTNDPVEIQRKQLYWILLVGVIIAVCFFSIVISPCMRNG